MREDRHARADGERQPVARTPFEGNPSDGLLQLHALILRLPAAATGEHHDELVARVADAHVVRPNRALQHAGDLAQRGIAGLVPVGVVDVLEAIEVHDDQGDFVLETRRARELARQMLEHRPCVRQSGERIRQRILLCLLEDDGVVDDRTPLLTDPLQQPPVVFAVEARLRVIHRERADQQLPEDERADERGLQDGRRIRAHRLEVGAGPRVDQRAAIPDHPSVEPLPAAERELLQQLGIGARGETAMQMLRRLRIQE